MGGGYNLLALACAHPLLHDFWPRYYHTKDLLMRIFCWVFVGLAMFFLSGSCSTPIPEEYFDPGWFIEALLRSYDYRPGVKSAFMSLYQRFFLATRADASDAEGEASD